MIKKIKTSLDAYFIECKRINSMNFTKKINIIIKKIKTKKKMSYLVIFICDNVCVTHCICK